jgi:hypothetical protein
VNQGVLTEGVQEREGRRHRRQPPPLLVQHPSEIELSPVRESQKLWLRLWVAMLVCWGCKWAERWERKGVWGYLSGAMASVTGAAGRGVRCGYWPCWAVASSARRSVRGADGFWTGAGGRGRRDGRADRPVTSARVGVRRWPRCLTGERAGVAVPVGCSCRV